MSLPPPQSRTGCRPPVARARRAGLALVIVLAFIALLTGLIVAYFARSMTSRQLANSSASQTKSAMLARSASDIVIAGLKQEIAAGSFTPAQSPSPSPAYPYYVPTPAPNGQAGAYVVPVRFGTPSPSPGPSNEVIPNLVRRSVRDDSTSKPIPLPAVPSLASAVSSDKDAATNGHTIPLSRWNSHYLIPSYQAVSLAASGVAIAPSTPDNFTAPDWVLVSRSGPAVQTSLGSGATALNNAAPNNSNYVIGRYAYAIYDEGGLLDMNVAGHPTPTGSAVPTTSPPSGFTATQVGQKGSLAMADLTQLPIVKSPVAPTSPASPNPTTDYLSQAFVDSLVGWRNNAAANPSGAFPTFTFNASQANSWFTNFAYQNTTGFLRAYIPANTTGTNVPTDQAILSRQQLLHLQNPIGFSANVLQFMGTFSRSLEQPSFVPAHILFGNSAPYINNVAQTAPPPASEVNTYLGNNDTAGSVNSISGQDIANPSLLTIRVAPTRPQWIRSDLANTVSVPGEPLLKERFPLSRLGEISYSATDSTPSLTDPNFTPLPSNPTAKNHIKDWFGLSRTSASQAWTYNHGAASILTLSQVAALNPGREPDFAELLKAAINVGSLAKGGPNLHNSQGNYQYTIDTSVEYNVLQVMANLIDQFDTDSYPTVVQIAAGSVMRMFRGVEDLPYFYRYHPFSVVTQIPNPLLDKSKQVAFTVAAAPTPGATPTVKTLIHCEPLSNYPGGISNPGHMVGLYIPEVWNPHDPSGALNAGGARPPRFRLSVVTDDPAAQTPEWHTGVKSQMNDDWYDVIPPKASIPEALLALEDPVVNTSSASMTAFTFSDDGGKLFREPTLLWHANSPTNINLMPENGSLAGPYTDVNTSISYYGVQIGQGAISYTGRVDHTMYPTSPQDPSDMYLFQASDAKAWSDSDNGTLTPGAYVQYTFRLQYSDPNGSGNWITYDEKYPDIHGLTQSPLTVNIADYANNEWANPLPNGGANQLSDNATGYDPRTARFGVGTSSEFDDDVMPLEQTAAANYNNDTTIANTAIEHSNFTVLVTQRPFADIGSKVKYSNPGMASDANGGNELEERWFSGRGWNASATATGASGWPLEYDGVLFGQNNPSINILARNGSYTSPQQHLYYEDADGMNRRSMGAYAYLDPSGNLPATGTTQYLEGLPHATANTYPSSQPVGVGQPTAQSLSRPIMLNRPFRSVAEMSYASRGTPWKQIDFFTPESGDTGLLDVFCVNETPANGIVAGKLNMNTHQLPVLQAIVAGTTRDELENLATPPSYAQTALTGSEAANIATHLVSITTDKTDTWRGPLMFIGDLVGHFVNAPINSSTASDLYSFKETVSGATYNYAGLSAALDMTVYTQAATSAATARETARIQRLHESPIRGLADSGQTRIWNLMIDVVAQTGRYTANSTSLAQFAVDGESRCWVHVAIDRYTGQVIDKQIEQVSE